MAQHAKRPTLKHRVVATLSVLLPCLLLVGVGVFALTGRGERRVTTEPPVANLSQEKIKVKVAEPRNRAAVSLPDVSRERLRLEKARISQKQTLVHRRKLAVEAQRASLPSTFRVASLNVLGASHTGKGGNKLGRGWGSGYSRMQISAGLLGSYNVSVVGFQEFESVQHSAFVNLTGGAWSVYPGGQLGPKSVRFSIAWRNADWTLVSASSISLPYAGGGRIAMPLVLLQRNDTGRQVYFMNVHNPADTKRLGKNAKWRAVARSLEIAKINEIQSTTGIPLILTGDMNGRAEVFCHLTGNTDLRSASGGSVRGQACAPPPRMGVDWIYGTSQMTFANYTEIWGGLVRRATDHPLVFADATVAGDDVLARGKG